MAQSLQNGDAAPPPARRSSGAQYARTRARGAVFSSRLRARKRLCVRLHRMKTRLRARVRSRARLCAISSTRSRSRANSRSRPRDRDLARPPLALLCWTFSARAHACAQTRTHKRAAWACWQVCAVLSISCLRESESLQRESESLQREFGSPDSFHCRSILPLSPDAFHCRLLLSIVA